MNYDKLTESNGTISKYPNLRPFPKGVSGNPGGRPKKGPASEIYENIWEDPKFREEFKRATMARMLSNGVAGFLMSREVVDRIEGPVKQEMSLEVTVSL